MCMGKRVAASLKDCPALGIRGILGVEAAAGYWGLSAYSFMSHPIFLASAELDRIRRVQGDISYLLIPPSIANLADERTVYFQDGIYVTDKQQTICDMIRFDADEFTKLESIYNYYCYEDVPALESMARSLGIIDELHRLYSIAERDMNDG